MVESTLERGGGKEEKYLISSSLHQTRKKGVSSASNFGESGKGPPPHFSPSPSSSQLPIFMPSSVSQVLFLLSFLFPSGEAGDEGAEGEAAGLHGRAVQRDGVLRGER